MKKCTRCGIEKTLDRFYFQKNKFNGGLTTYCKDCLCAERKKYREANPEKMRQIRKDYRKNNKEKIAEAGRRRWLEHTKHHPEKTRYYRIKSEYGITKTQHDQMLLDQGSKCTICEKVFIHGFGKGGTNFGVDHCHKTGKVRGLLCHPCNSAIGLVKENVTILSKMIEYLKFHGESNGNNPTDAV